MTQFTVAHGTPKTATLRRHRNEVVISFAGRVDQDDKSLTLNKAIWDAILKHAKVDKDMVYFDRDYVKYIVCKLARAGTPTFCDDKEAMEKLAKVTAFFSQERPVSVVGQRVAY